MCAKVFFYDSLSNSTLTATLILLAALTRRRRMIPGSDESYYVLKYAGNGVHSVYVARHRPSATVIMANDFFHKLERIKQKNKIKMHFLLSTKIYLA